MSESFERLGITAPLVTGLKKAGIKVPTRIQQDVIPLALSGKDVIGQSATGTGKTLAYLLPLFQRIDTAKRETQVIILSPTYELAIQIQRQIEELAKNAALAVTAAPIIGNVNIARQIDKLKEKPHMIVGSSGRILELIQKKKISAQTVKTIVLDEADRLLDEHNIESVKAVIKTTLRDRQLMMFSATITPAAQEQMKKLMQEPAFIQVAQQTEVPNAISHMFFVTEQRDKIELLRKLVTNLQVERALVFINKSDNIAVLAAKLNYHGLKAAGIHGSSVKTDRKAALESFRKGKTQLLVASDLAARGLDIPEVTHVFNLDFPEDPQLYLHRVGRTGRAGQSGVAISILTKYEAAAVRKFEKLLNIRIAAKNLVKGKVVDVADKRKSRPRQV